MRDELLQAGADDFFAKPLDFDGLIYTAGGLLQARAQKAPEKTSERASESSQKTTPDRSMETAFGKTSESALK
jgi:DNA-binding response OmpR family regulator